MLMKTSLRKRKQVTAAELRLDGQSNRGAAGGKVGIPSEWIELVKRHFQVFEMTHTVFKDFDGYFTQFSKKSTSKNGEVFQRVPMQFSPTPTSMEQHLLAGGEWSYASVRTSPYMLPYADWYHLPLSFLGTVIKLTEQNYNLSHTELVCTRSWLLDSCQPTLRSVDIEEELDRCRLEFPSSSMVER
ncbi:hypothetical protein ANN_10064 [Periplaneta americana]|uniref:Uncharacterized protein n=1 Tax=Periplaneta americana TaxID=6978 RepID=A0ABQ8TQQ5_PERAM|nr:hypothetical protein ANN_10064 [Periplaneta americana]